METETAAQAAPQRGAQGVAVNPAPPDSQASADSTASFRQVLPGGQVTATGACQEIRNLENAIAYLEEAHIGTIHSFCAEILRARPVEANVDPAFRELSDPEAQRLYRQAFRRWSQQKLTASPPGLRRCLSRLAARSPSDDSTQSSDRSDGGGARRHRRPPRRGAP